MTQNKTEIKTSLTPVTEGQGFIVLNPIAGEGDSAETEALLQHTLEKSSYHLYKTTGEESIPDVVKTALQAKDIAWVAAVGGDGTVSQVANGLVGTDIPLVIIPAGTGNALAQELNIPQDIEAACQLLTQSSTIRIIDAMRVKEQYFFLQLGIGIESITMKNTPSAQKNKFGSMAYLWTAIKEVFGWQPYQYTLTIDGKTDTLRASELVVANAATIGIFDLKWRDIILPDDGCLNIAVVRARSLRDYAHVLWALFRNQQNQSDHIQFFTSTQEIRLEMDQAVPIHGDGEILEETTPLTAVVVPKALQVIVPDTP